MRAFKTPVAEHSRRESDLEAVDRAALETVTACARAGVQLVLAVSGGCDSMVLMHAVARVHEHASGESTPATPPQVVTFDHGTGPAASRAVMLVQEEAHRLGFEIRVGRGSLGGGSESAWREARWRFFRNASPKRAVVATAHTRDDQLETVVMRTIRRAGARGLAGLEARAPGVTRPFLHISRATLRRYGNAWDIRFVEDPSNESRQYFRNRVRLDLLPAIERVSPRFADDMLALATSAARWRADVEALVSRFVSRETQDGIIRVARQELATYDSATLCVLWPAIAAHALVTLDRRGTLRLAQFTISGLPGARMQLSGGVEVYRHRDSFIIRRAETWRPSANAVPLSGAVRFGDWRFWPVDDSTDPAEPPLGETPGDGSRVQRKDTWVSDLPADRHLFVRAWQPGDRMRTDAGRAARRVKRFFGDEQIAGPRRPGWPVVLADDEIVWIPGVRRSDAASGRSGRPVIRYACEHNDGGHPSS